MIVSAQSISAAFGKHADVAAVRGWDIAHHLDLIRQARHGGAAVFEAVHEQLRRKWQAFRGGQSVWTAAQTFDELQTLPTQVRTLRLRDLDDSHVPLLHQTLTTMAGLKQNKGGASIVALSKVLHFWNPGLFLIVDQGVMWEGVLNHRWLWQQVLAVRTELDVRLSLLMHHTDAACDLPTYLAILVWAGRLIRQNPAILKEFGHYVSVEIVNAGDFADCDSVAVEWLLLGLVELPPAGVTGIEPTKGTHG